MIAALDVCYRSISALAACVLFEEWTSDIPKHELQERIEKVHPYEPGSFYLRELPCLLTVLSHLKVRVEAVIIDGYVWLGLENRPGLGARLYDALDHKTAVVGVAKSPFRSALNAQRVFRGKSIRPLYVTSAGMGPAEAAERIAAMHGSHRIPTLLKRVDRLCRAVEWS
jgi:deoxyribonuclease V